MVGQSHYHFDEVTRKITFHKDAYHYQFEKKIFAECGVDIDTIKTVDEYDVLLYEYRETFNIAVKTHWQNTVTTTLEEKYRKSLMLGDIDEAKRLRQILLKKKALHLKVIK